MQVSKNSNQGSVCVCVVIFFLSCLNKRFFLINVYEFFKGLNIAIKSYRWFLLKNLFPLLQGGQFGQVTSLSLNFEDWSPPVATSLDTSQATAVALLLGLETLQRSSAHPPRPSCPASAEMITFVLAEGLHHSLQPDVLRWQLPPSWVRSCKKVFIEKNQPGLSDICSLPPHPLPRACQICNGIPLTVTSLRA